MFRGGHPIAICSPEGSWPRVSSAATIPHVPAQVFRLWKSASDPATWKLLIRVLSQHSGVPALVVGAILVVVGYRLLKRSARFLAEVALVTAALFAATQLGWIRW
jgi:hypothetical protein